MLLPNLLKEKGIFGRLALLQMDSLASLTSDLSRQLDQADKHTQSSTADIHALTQLALDRLAQALQVAMANGALLCSRGACVRVSEHQRKQWDKKDFRGANSVETLCDFKKAK